MDRYEAQDSVAGIPAAFRCAAVPDGERVIVRPKGELDLCTCERLQRCLGDLAAAGFVELTLDLGSLQFIDSSGIALVLHWMGRDDIELELEVSTDVVRRAFLLAGVPDVIA